MAQEIYVSTDIETDGPIPGRYSMLSFGSVAFLADGAEVASYSANLATLEGADASPNTMDWWKKHPDAWAKCRENPQPVDLAMRSYLEWLKALPGKPVFVGYPAGFDFLFVYWYLIAFTGESPFSFSALDIKSYAMAVMKTSFRETSKKRMPKEWFPTIPHEHVALADAREQGLLFINILRANGMA